MNEMTTLLSNVIDWAIANPILGITLAVLGHLALMRAAGWLTVRMSQFRAHEIDQPGDEA